MRINDLRGKTFGNLLVLDEKPIRKNNNTYWKCKCICGNEKYIFHGNLISNRQKGCGCLQNNNPNRKTQHKRLIKIFNNMKQRCYNPKSENYKHYGGKGIKICSQWLKDSKNFYNWSINNGYADSLSIDRINVNSDYEPNNCRWINMKSQANNRSNNRLITIKGKTKTASQWAEEFGITHEGLIYRYRNNLI